VWLIVPSTESESAEARLASNSDSKPQSPAIERPVWWNAKLRSPGAWVNALKKDRSLNSLGGMTLEPSMADRGVELFRSSLRASLSRHGALPENAAGKTTNGGSGRALRKSSNKSNRKSSSSKTSPACSSSPTAMLTDGIWTNPQKTLLGDSEPYSETWPGSGSMRNGQVFARPMWVPPMAGQGSSFWPTPDAELMNDGSDPQKHSERLARLAAKHNNGNGAGTPLGMAAKIWQTPATDAFRSRGGDRKDEQGLDQQARLWATPMSRDTRSGETIADYGNARPLNEQAAQWGTPRVTTNDMSGNYRVDAKSRLEDQAFMWGTPMASDRSHDPRTVDHGIQIANQAEMWNTPHGQGNTDATGKQGGTGGGEFSKQVNNWATPRAEDSESCGNHPDASDSLTGQTKMWNTPHAPRAHDSEHSETSYLARQISSLQGPASPDGKICWCGSPGCALPTHKRKLNPIFETWLMGWPLLWLMSAPERYGRLAMELYRSKLRSRLRFYCGEF
jgi:hypothetical protein